MPPENYKYNFPFIDKELDSMLEHLKKDSNVIFIWQLFEHKDYSRQRFSDWYKQDTPLDDKEKTIIKSKMDTIKEILESRAVVGGMNWSLNAWFTQFHLKNNYRDKYEERVKRDDTIHTVDSDQNDLLNDISE